MVSVLLVSLRQSAAVAAAEYADVARATGLAPEELTQRMLDSAAAGVGSLVGFDAVIVGGSSLNVTTRRHEAWQRRIHAELSGLAAQDIPSIFICYGHTFLAADGGGRVGRSHPETSGPTVVELTAAGLEDPLAGTLPRRFTSLTGHTENVGTVGAGAVVLATGPSCPVQLVRVNRSTWSCQFHPEMDAAAMKSRMDFYSGHGYFSPADYESIVAGLPAVDTSWSHQLLRNFVTLAATGALRGRGTTVGADVAVG